MLLLLSGALRSAPSSELVVVVGAPGTIAYGESFTKSSEAWKAAGKRGHAKVTVIGKDEGIKDLEKLESTVKGTRAKAAISSKTN